jgi:hypothetical protein
MITTISIQGLESYYNTLRINNMPLINKVTILFSL